MRPVGRPWAGAYLEHADTMLVFRAALQEFTPDGFYYCWQGRTDKGVVRTLEPVFGTRTLQPGQVSTHRWQLLFFRGIRHLRGLYRATAFDAEFSDGYLVLTVAAAAPFPGADAEVRLRSDQSVVDVVKLRLPTIAAGASKKIEVSPGKMLPPGRYRLTLVIGNETVPLIGPLVNTR